MSRCECDWRYHKGEPCPNDAADHGTIRTSPEYCIPCLYVCCAERDDELHPRLPVPPKPPLPWERR